MAEVQLKIREYLRKPLMLDYDDEKGWHLRDVSSDYILPDGNIARTSKEMKESEELNHLLYEIFTYKFPKDKKDQFLGLDDISLQSNEEFFKNIIDEKTEGFTAYRFDEVKDTNGNAFSIAKRGNRPYSLVIFSEKGKTYAIMASWYNDDASGVGRASGTPQARILVVDGASEEIRRTLRDKVVINGNLNFHTPDANNNLTAFKQHYNGKSIGVEQTTATQTIFAENEELPSPTSPIQPQPQGKTLDAILSKLAIPFHKEDSLENKTIIVSNTLLPYLFENQGIATKLNDALNAYLGGNYFTMNHRAIYTVANFEDLNNISLFNSQNPQKLKALEDVIEEINAEYVKTQETKPTTSTVGKEQAPEDFTPFAKNRLKGNDIDKYYHQLHTQQQNEGIIADANKITDFANRTFKTTDGEEKSCLISYIPVGDPSVFEYNGQKMQGEVYVNPQDQHRVMYLINLDNNKAYILTEDTSDTPVYHISKDNSQIARTFDDTIQSVGYENQFKQAMKVSSNEINEMINLMESTPNSTINKPVVLDVVLSGVNNIVGSAFTEAIAATR